MRIIMTAAAAVTAIGALGLPSSAQDRSRPKPNIAVSGCLMREGYGTYIVAKANIDAVGEGVETAKPGGVGKASPNAPPKWILDHPGSIGQHVGETIQVIGVSSWVDANRGGAKAGSDEPTSSPHTDVQRVKFVTAVCS